VRKLNLILLIAAVLWTALLAAALAWSLQVERARTMTLAENEAQANFNKDVAFRKWATRHGGVYVPTDARTPANPNLADVPERDLVTPSGRRLTLMNPAYMLRQLMQEYGEEYGVKGTITSLRLLNPANAPDAWAHDALYAFEHGIEEVKAVVDIDGAPYMRLMHRLTIQPGCLKCHGKQGYKVGDVRGGVGVAVPLKPYLTLEREKNRVLWLLHGGIWLLGLTGLGTAGVYGRRQIRLANDAHQDMTRIRERMELVLASSGDGSWDWDVQSGTAYFDSRWTGMLGYGPDEVPAAVEGWKALIHPDDRREVETTLREHLDGLRPDYEVAFRMRTRSGAWKWIQARGKVVERDATGAALRMTGTHSDIDARKAMEHELIELAQRNRLILNSAGEGIFGLDRRGNHSFVNPVAARMLGYRPEELIGRHSHSTWHHSHPDGTPYPETECPVYAVLRDGLSRHVAEDWFLRKDGSNFPVEFWATPILEEGAVTGVVVSFLDITERELAEAEIHRLNSELEARVHSRTLQLEAANQALRQAKEAAEAANRAKSVFLANMSHELRTPLNAILGFAQLLERDARIPDDERGNIATINRSGHHLLALINDVLEISRIEAGRAAVVKEAFDPLAAISDVEDMIRLRAEAKGLAFIVARPDDLPAQVLGDAHRLRQVLINLLGNAVKYTEQGEIRLDVATEPGDRMRFTVSDTGPGIAETEQTRIFEAFYQTEAGITQGEGTGLGLTISQEFVRLMGGEISLESEPGQGSRFSFSVPLPVADTPPPEIRRGRVASLAPGQVAPRILVAEDHPDNQRVVTRLLEQVGCQVRIAQDGHEAVELFQSWRPRLILMDMRMPVMDGYAATRAIRALPGGAGLPIVALTASAFAEDRGKVLAAGCDEMVRKPIEATHLFEVIGALLGLTFNYTEVAGKTAMTHGDLTALPATTRQELAEAAAALDKEATLDIVARLRAKHPDEADFIAALIEDYRFDLLLDHCTGG